jgi:hypothetical protein
VNGGPGKRPPPDRYFALLTIRRQRRRNQQPTPSTAVELVRLFSMLLLRAEFGFGLHQAWLNFNAQYGKHNMESAHANSRREPNSYKRRTRDCGSAKRPDAALSLDATIAGLSDRPNGRRFRVARAADRGKLGPHNHCRRLALFVQEPPRELTRQ